MKLARLERILAAYGCDPAAWPSREVEAARILLAKSDTARQLLLGMTQLEIAVAETHDFGQVSDLTIKRIMNGASARIDAIERTKLKSPASLPRLAWLKPAGFAFGALLLFATGLELGAAHSVAQAGQTTAAKLIIDGPYRSFAVL